MKPEAEASTYHQRFLTNSVTIEVIGFDGQPVLLTGVTFGDIERQIQERGLSLVKPAEAIVSLIIRHLPPAPTPDPAPLRPE
jgi:hypothetical protein